MINSSFEIKDLSLTDQGRERVEWALTGMPVLSAIDDRFAKERLLSERRLVNLAAAEGHPATVMDMSFAYLRQHRGDSENAVYPDIDQQVATMKPASMRLSIDSLSREQKTYLSSWKEGT